MAEFFDQILRTEKLSPQEALRNAQLRYKSEINNDPRFWAAFSVFGIPDPDVSAKRLNGDLFISVFLNENIANHEDKIAITRFLKELNIGEVVKDSLVSDLIISQSAHNYTLTATKSTSEIGVFEINNPVGIKMMNQKIFRFAQGEHLKNLKFKGSDLSIRLIQVEYERNGEIESNLKLKGPNESSILKIKSNEDFALLQATNNGEVPLYFCVYEIDSSGEITAFLPNESCSPYREDCFELKLNPGETKYFKDCIFSFSPPYEKLTLKAFAKPEPDCKFCHLYSAEFKYEIIKDE